MSITILGVDLGKNSCSVVGVDVTGAVVVRRTMRRQTLIDYVTKLPACVVAMEACCGAHHLGRLFVAQGHEIRLMSPEYVRPYIKAQKNDDRDAEGIAEAASRPTMRFVELKNQEQLDIQNAASCALAPRGRTNQPHQSTTRDPAGARGDLPGRSAEIRAGRGWHACRWRSNIVPAYTPVGWRFTYRMERARRENRGVEWRICQTGT